MSAVISLKNISKHIKKSPILENISFDIQKGEVFGFIGPNGAGKTTTLKTILGIIAPSQGEVRIFGASPTDVAVQKRIGFMPENTYLYKYLTGDEFLDFCGKFYSKEANWLHERKEYVLDRVGLANARHKKLSTYSKGMLQRIGLAQAILHDPEIIFLDEPMSGLDPIGRKMIKDLILDLKKAGKTIFFNTHILSDVETICDRCAIIAGGKIRAEKNMNELTMPLEDYFLEIVEDVSKTPRTKSSPHKKPE